MNRKGISLVAFKDMEELGKTLLSHPDACYELSYTMDEETLQRVLPVLTGRITSIHSLCPRREWFPNFASSDENVIAWSEKELLKDADLAAAVGAQYLVLHPGYLTDQLVPRDTDTRMHMMEDLFSQYVLPGTKNIARPDYIHTDEYRKALQRLEENIVDVSRKIREKGVTLAIENLNPRSGYMLIHPDEIVELSKEEEIHFTIDIGHLWITTELYQIDFLSSLKRILATGKVVTTHLHSNITDGRIGIFEDSHQDIDGNKLPWKEALRLIQESGANMIIEAKENPEHNLDLLFTP